MIAAVILCAALGQQPSGTPDLRCGSYCLYISLKALDVPGVTFEALEQKLGAPAPAGYSLAQLDDAARGYGLHTLGVETTCDNLELREQPFACIALLKGGHFVNLGEVDEKTAQIIDPPKEYALPRATLEKQWNGTALLLSRGPLAPEAELRRSRRAWWIAGAIVAAIVAAVLAIRMGSKRGA